MAIGTQAKKAVEIITAPGPGMRQEEVLAHWAKQRSVRVHSARLIRVLGLEHVFEVVAEEAAAGGQAEGTALLTPEGVDFSRDELLTPFGLATLKDRYLLPHEVSPQEAFMRAARAFADDEAHAQRLYDYASRLWFMFATPVLSNPPRRLSWGVTFEDNFAPEHFELKKRGMPISCFLNYVPDSREGLTAHYTENAWLSSIGGGIGAYWGAVRSNGTNTSAGSASSGVIPFIGVMDRMVLAFAQGVTRRASYAMYLDISHPEIVEFLDIRKPTGGDANRKCLNLHNAVNIPDSFMEIIEECVKNPDACDDWPLIDPHTRRVTETVSARALWQRLLELRMQTGEPYIMFVDTVNRALPLRQREAGLRVYQSNLCSEITLPTDEHRTAVCCLSSVNLEYFDEWSKHPQFIEDLVRMLDNVLEFFIRNAPPDLAKARYSAAQERSIGLGAMGFHSYLQRRGLPFESAMATSVNRQVFAHIKRRAEGATVRLAKERGPCPDAQGDMTRNMHLLAVAPNASSSIICGGTSPSVEPVRANAFTHKTQSGSWLVRNKYLEDVLEQYRKNTPEVWQSITLNRGSVQHLDFLSQQEKDTFKTAMELDQRWIIEHAAHRQEYICQAQSVNLFMPADADVLYLHNVHFMAWKKGLKTLYYMRSEAIRRADTVSAKLSKQELKSPAEVCLSCEG
jgi:ribonucleoside-diphosphate reductase alpha chain